VIELGVDEIGLRYENDVLVEVLAPNTRRLYWKGYIDVRFEIVNIAEDFVVSKALLPKLIAGITRGVVKVVGGEGVFAVQVPQ